MLHGQQSDKLKSESISSQLANNKKRILDSLGNSSDVIMREFTVGNAIETPAGIFYIDGLANDEIVCQLVENLMRDVQEDLVVDRDRDLDLFVQLRKHTISLGELRIVTEFAELFTSLLSGETILLLDGHNCAMIIGSRNWKDRGVPETSVETVVRGPRESFSETLRTNTSLIRRRIKDPRLWIESRRIGRVTKTDVAVMYIKGIAEEQVIEEVFSRLDRINIDAILETGYIEELIQDEAFALFPTMFNTERPDVVAAGLLEGRVAILVDGTPVVLLVPVIFSQFIQAAEDYYHLSNFSFFRFLRWIALMISLLLPSFYIAITTFHQEMLPTTLLINLASQREGVPFPAAIEALIMELTFEILREAGIRMPRMIGPAISIVGALVIGEAAVEAGLITAAKVIVVGLTAIASFTIPSVSMSIPVRILRFIIMMAAASFGIFGVFLTFILILLHLCSLRSFGVPYMSPFAPFNINAQRDALIRFPLWALHSRPRFISKNNLVREENSKPQKPKPRS